MTTRPAAGVNERLNAYPVLRQMVMDKVELGEIDPSGDRTAIIRSVRDVVEEYQQRAFLDDATHPVADAATMVERLVAALVDYGPLTDLLERDDIEEILIQGARVAYITSDGHRHVLQRPTTEADNRNYVERLLHAEATGERQLDAANPILTVGLRGASRLSVKIPPVVEELTVCIRKVVAGARRPTLAQLTHDGALSTQAARFLWTLMQVRTRVLVSGAPGAGKTTLVNALLAAVPDGRVVRVNEEDREITVPLLLGGYAQATGRPGQTLRDLIRADLRFRPDLLVVGEVRGAEAFELLRPLNAGVGFLTTVHANQANEALDALVTAATHAGELVDEHSLRRLFARSIDFVVYIDHDDRQGGPRRHVTEVSWVDPELRDGRVVYEPLFVRAGLGALEWTGAQPREDVVHRLQKGLPRGVTLKDVLAGEAMVGGLQ